MFPRMLQSKRKENGVGRAMQSSNLLSGNWETVDAVSIVFMWNYHLWTDYFSDSLEVSLQVSFISFVTTVKSCHAPSI